ncbi:MAG: pirin family protein [Alphaproteobacteria bacterium]|nr:MAG: pirin family protein [Alphaproteobacteria bacterium]
MIERRAFDRLGGGDHGWLNTRHHFSFADYRDPKRMDWGALRVFGNKGRTKAGDVQVMSAGTGIRHSEYNLEDEPTAIFQLWIIPTRRGGDPGWDTRPFPQGEGAGHFVTLASGIDGDADALPIRADARVLGATLKAGETAEYRLAPNRRAYLVPAKGAVEVNGVRIEARDGAAIENERVLTVTALDDAEIVLADVS